MSIRPVDLQGMLSNVQKIHSAKQAVIQKEEIANQNAKTSLDKEIEIEKSKVHKSEKTQKTKVLSREKEEENPKKKQEEKEKKEGLDLKVGDIIEDEHSRSDIEKTNYKENSRDFDIVLEDNMTKKKDENNFDLKINEKSQTKSSEKEKVSFDFKIW